MSTSFRVILPYRYFAVCDWITEPGIVETFALLALARSDVAASDGRQIIVCPASESAVTVHFEPLGDALAAGDDGWDGHIDLRVECPSGTIYIDQPSALAIDLEDAPLVVAVDERSYKPKPTASWPSTSSTSTRSCYGVCTYWW